MRYRLHWEDGSDSGDVDYLVNVKPDWIIWTGDGRRLRVLDLASVDVRPREAASP